MGDKERFGPERRTCGTTEYHLHLLRADPGYRERYLKNQQFINAYLRKYRGAGQRSGIVTIPVVVHVLWNTAAQNTFVSDAQIHSQIDVLNQDYRGTNSDRSNLPPVFAPLAADVRLQFQLAVRDPKCQATTGITRTQTSVQTFDVFGSDDMKSTAAGGIDPWPADRYLNIWVCEGKSDQLGRGTFPGTAANVDGLVVVIEAFGTIGALYSLYNRGRTATHEIGHYFDLHHPWGDQSSNPSCVYSDYVDDTPMTSAPNYDTPTFPHVSCSNGPNGDLFMNFMDYVDDPVMIMFTLGQAARIEAALAGPRAGLVASDALIPAPPPGPAIIWSADTPSDQGDEPDTASSTFCQSDDIWVRNQNDGNQNQEHQAPKDGITNYVYVRVRNRSCTTAGSGTVKLYWAKASTGLQWPDPWDGSVTTPALMGSPIGSKTTGSIPGRGSVILEFPWSPPNPQDYASFGADKAHFCLLSRVETQSTAPYGMTFPETSDLWANVRNNNKIVWKNIEVLESGNRIAYTTIGNFMKEAARFSFALAMPGGEQHACPIEQLGLLTLDFGTDVNRLLAKVTPRTLATTDEQGRLVVQRFGGHLGPIALKPREFHGVSLTFVPTRTRLRTNGVYTFDLMQYRQDEARERVIGGQRFVFKLCARKREDLPAHLIGHWIHSHEEDQPGVQAFRPGAYKFPPSRGRAGFELREDGTAIMYDIGPADGRVESEGFWYEEDDGRVFIGFADPNREPQLLDIVSAAPGRLMLKARA